MKKFTILFLFISLALIGYNQITFNRTYFEGVGYSVKQTPDNGYIATGCKDVNDTNHIAVIRTNELGDLIWTKDYGSGEVRSINLTDDGGYIIAGYKKKSDSTHMGFWFKIDDYGNIVWSKEYSSNYSDVVTYAEQTTDGGYIITGTSFEYDSVLIWLDNLILIKVDENGDIDWMKIFDDCGGNCVRQTEDGGFIVAGFTDAGWIYSFGYLIKTDENGDPIWTYSGGMGFKSVEQTIDGGYIVSTSGQLYGAPCGLVLKRFNEDGGIIWNQYYFPWTLNFFNEVHQTEDDGFIAVYSGGVLKTNNNGDSLWMYSYWENGSGLSVQQTSDGGYIVVGGNEGLFALVKSDENGCLTGIVESDVFQELHIYPNPATFSITIELPAQPQKNTSLAIANTSGQQLITWPLTDTQTEIDIGHLPVGIYILKVSNDRDVRVQKVIKQ